MPARTRIAFTGLMAMVPPRKDGPALALCPSTKDPLANLPAGASRNAHAPHYPIMAVTRTKTVEGSGAPFHPTSMVVPLAGCVVRLMQEDPDSALPAVPEAPSWAAFKGFMLKDLWNGGVVDPALLPAAASADPRIVARVEVWLGRYLLTHAGLAVQEIGFSDPAKPKQRPAGLVVLELETGVWVEVLKAGDLTRQALWYLSGDDVSEVTITFSHNAWAGLEVPSRNPDYQFLRFYELLDPALKPGRTDSPPVPVDPPGEGDVPRCVPAGLEAGA